jgi:hypothetical protein
MNAREKVWRFVEANRKRDVFRGTSRDLSEGTGVPRKTIDVMLTDWHLSGDLVKVRLGCRRIVAVPDLRTRRASWDETALAALRERHGVSRRELAARLGKTKNAVDGMLWRTQRRERDARRDNT